MFLAFTPKDRKPGEIEKPGNYLLKKLNFSSEILANLLHETDDNQRLSIQSEFLARSHLHFKNTNYIINKAAVCTVSKPFFFLSVISKIRRKGRESNGNDVSILLTSEEMKLCIQH